MNEKDEKQKVTIGEINLIIQPRQKYSGRLSNRFKANKQDQKSAQSKTMGGKILNFSWSRKIKHLKQILRYNWKNVRTSSSTTTNRSQQCCSPIIKNDRSDLSQVKEPKAAI